MMINRPPRRRIVAAAVVALTALLAACSSGGGAPNDNTTGATVADADRSGYPVTITNCGKELTFDKAPSRAVTNDITTFEDMAALGLQPRMIGTFGIKDFGRDGKGNVPARDAAAYAEVKAVSPDAVALEPLVGLKPDFLFAGWNYGLKIGSTLTPDNLARYGITTLALTESCAHVQSTKRAVGIEDTYTDLTNLGRIFGVEDRADRVITGMKQRIAAVRTKLRDVRPKPVFLYDSGTDAPFTSPGLAMPDALMTLGGGRNVMHDLKQTWTSVSWEQAVATKPACIIVNEYGSPTYADKVRFLRTSPITRDLPAVRNDCFIRLDYAQLTPGPNNADAVEIIAKALHPDRF